MLVGFHASIFEIVLHGTRACPGRLVFGGAFLLYGTDDAIAQILFGLGDLSRSTQSVCGVQGCPYTLSVGEALTVFGGQQETLSSILTGAFTGSAGNKNGVAPVPPGRRSENRTDCMKL